MLYEQNVAFVTGPSGAETPRIESEAISATGVTLPHCDVEIHIVPRMPKTVRTIGFSRLQYEVTAEVEALVKKAGGMWTYMNGKYFPSRGRTDQVERALVKAGLVAVTSMKATRTVLALKKELKTL